MKEVVRHLAVVSAIGLIVLGVLVFCEPTSETPIKLLAILGFLAAILIIVAIEWWRRDEEEYERQIERRNKYRMLKS